MELWYSLGSGSPGSALRLGSCAIFCACCLCQANVPLWNEVSTAGSVQARYDLSGVLTPSGRAYVFGGSDASTGRSDLWYIDIEAVTPTWIEVPASGITPRRGHSAVINAAGVMWVFAGVFENSSYQGWWDDVWTIDLEASTPAWSPVITASRPRARDRASAVLSPTGEMWVFAGFAITHSENDLWHINTMEASPSWTEATVSGTLPAVRGGHTAVISPSGRMFVFGGASGAGHYNDLWFIDALSLEWHEVAVLGSAPLVRDGASAVLTPTGKMWIFGGYSPGTGHLDDLWYVDTEAGSPSWTPVSMGTAPPGRFYPYAFLTPAGHMYIFAGQGISGRLADLWFVNIETTTTTTTDSTSTTSTTSSGTGTSHSYIHGHIIINVFNLDNKILHDHRHDHNADGIDIVIVIIIVINIISVGNNFLHHHQHNNNKDEFDVNIIDLVIDHNIRHEHRNNADEFDINIIDLVIFDHNIRHEHRNNADEFDIKIINLVIFDHNIYRKHNNNTG
eukprot:s6153_g5.t1